MTSLRRSLLLSGCLLLAGCQERRHAPHVAPPSYREVAPLLAKACLECHGERSPSAGYSVVDHWSSIGCTSDGRAVTRPLDARAPLIRVLARTDHAGLVSDRQRDLLLAWLLADTPRERKVIHAAGILDPRSEGWHGTLAADDGYRALWDDGAQLACGRCHQGAPAGARGQGGITDGASACTSCHSQREGVLACSTCHGDQERSYPPRNACYFDAPAQDPHAAHVAHPQFRRDPLACGTCHPLPEDDLFSAAHIDGQIDVRFSSALLDQTAVVNPDGTCSVTCHARAGRRSTPTWQVEAALDCQSCHLSPPRDHPPGACRTCHANMGDDPESLIVNALHINGTVDIGKGDGTCGSCHGHDERGAPSDPGHDQHLTSKLSEPLACTSCHRTPSLGDLHDPETHMNGSPDVFFGERATGKEGIPSFDAAQKTCAQVACHGDSLVEPRWGRVSQASATCSACHQTPPPPPHSTLPGCGGALCHGSEVAPTSPGFRITESGRKLHIDGVLSIGMP